MVRPSNTAPRSTAQIRDDIERTRADMDRTVGALEDRLSPGGFADELWKRVRGRADGRGIGDIVTEHPVPLALMGLGLGWLAIEESTGRSVSSHRQGMEHSETGTTEPAEGRRGPYGPDAIDHSDPRWVHGSSEAGVGERAKSAAHRLGEVAEGAKEKVTDALASSREKVSDALSSSRQGMSGAAGSMKERLEDVSEREGRATEHLREGAHRMAERGRGRARRAGAGISGFIDENPLAAAIVAFGFGMASGLSAPPTDVESRVLGRSSRAVKDETSRAMREARQSARDVVESAAGAAQEGLAEARGEEGDTRTL